MIKYFLVSLMFLTGQSYSFANEKQSNFFTTAKALFISNHTTLSSVTTSKVTKITKKFGESFKKGELLISLDSSLQQADYKASKIVLNTAKTKLSATSSLYDDGNASRVELEEVRSRYAVAEREFIETQSQLKECSIYAPFDGRIVEVSTHEHEIVKYGQPLIIIINDINLFAHILLPKEIFPVVTTEMTVPIVVPDLNITIEGKIKYISAEIDPASETFEVKILVNNKDKKLRSGMDGFIDLKQFLKKINQGD